MSQRVVRTPAAEQDLIDIWLHVAVDSPRAADQLLDHIGARLALLADFPELGPSRPDIGDGLRHLVAASYLVLYRLPPAGGVEIVRVMHGRRNLVDL